MAQNLPTLWAGFSLA